MHNNNNNNNITRLNTKYI